MNTKKKLNYSTEFKTRIILELFQSKCTMKEISQKYALSLSTLSHWKKIILQNASAIFISKELQKNDNHAHEVAQRKHEQLLQQLTVVKREKDNVILKYKQYFFEKKFSKNTLFSAQEQYKDHYLHYLLIS